MFLATAKDFIVEKNLEEINRDWDCICQIKPSYQTFMAFVTRMYQI